MAKQNVTFMERHFEKIVVGVAGAVLVAMIVLFGIGSPNTVTVEGEKLGPGDFYTKLGDMAKQASEKIKRGQLKPIESLPRLAGGQEQNIYAKSGVPLTDLLAFTPPGMDVPGAIDPGNVGDRELARILSPKAIAVREGRGAVALPETGFVPVSQGWTRGNTVAPPTVDRAWTIVLAAVDRKAQKDVFVAAKYGATSQELVVADVQAERQELQPDGIWGPAQLIHGYAPIIHTVQDRVEATEQESRKVLSEIDRSYLDSYHLLLNPPDGQEQVLRPSFQEFLDKAPLVWAPPHKLVGYDFDLKEFGVSFPAEGAKNAVRPPPVAPGRSNQMPPLGRTPPPLQPGQPDQAMSKQIKELKAQAEAALSKKDYLKAQDAYQQIVQFTTNNPQNKDFKDASKKLEEIAPQVEEATRLKAIVDAQKTALNMQDFGPDQQPLWLTDVGVEPGHSYRYRVRLIAFNDYAGKFTLLKNIKDAEQVLLTGEWSEWSDPITVTPMVQAFFTDAKDALNGGGRQAHLQIYHFNNGKWLDEGHDYEVGQQIDYKNGLQKQAYDGIVTAIEADRPYTTRNKSALTPGASDVLTLVSAAGQVDERYAAEDKIRQRTFAELVKKEKELASSQSETGVMQRGPMMGGPGMMGGPMNSMGGRMGRVPPGMGGRRGGPMGPNGGMDRD